MYDQDDLLQSVFVAREMLISIVSLFFNDFLADPEGFDRKTFNLGLNELMASMKIEI